MIFKTSLRDHRLHYKRVNLLSHIYRFLFNPSYRLIWLFRLIQSCSVRSIKCFLDLYYLRQCNRFQITLDSGTCVGDGLIFPHNGPVVINKSTLIGRNAIIHPCVLLAGNRTSGAPIIGDNVFIGHGSKIIGKVHIGDDVFISPGAIITKDVKPDCLVGAGLNNVIACGGGKLANSRYRN